MRLQQIRSANKIIIEKYIKYLWILNRVTNAHISKIYLLLFDSENYYAISKKYIGPAKWLNSFISFE